MNVFRVGVFVKPPANLKFTPFNSIILVYYDIKYVFVQRSPDLAPILILAGNGWNFFYGFSFYMDFHEMYIGKEGMLVWLLFFFFVVVAGICSRVELSPTAGHPKKV